MKCVRCETEKASFFLSEEEQKNLIDIDNPDEFICEDCLETHSLTKTDLIEKVGKFNESDVIKNSIYSLNVLNNYIEIVEDGVVIFDLLIGNEYRNYVNGEILDGMLDKLKKENINKV